MAAACTATHTLHPLTAQGWAGCGVDELAGTVRNIVCQDLDLRVMRAQTLSGGPGVDAIAQSMPGGEAAHREIIRVGTLAIPARVHPDFLIAAPRADVLAVCRDSTPALSRCRTVIAVIAQSGLPPGVAFPETRLELLGHAFVVPPGCELAGERIACRETGFALDWREQEWADGADAALAAGARVIRARHPDVDEERVPCALLGQRGAGARYTVQTDAGVMHVLACVVYRGGVASVAQCQGFAPIAAPYPAPCDQVFAAPE